MFTLSACGAVSSTPVDEMQDGNTSSLQKQNGSKGSKGDANSDNVDGSATDGYSVSENDGGTDVKVVDAALDAENSNDSGCTEGACCSHETTYCHIGTGGACFNTKKDINHCGACGTTCAPKVVNGVGNPSTCDEGKCSDGIRCSSTVCCSTLPLGYQVCGDIPFCIDTQSEVSHCGRCGHKCTAGAQCFNGSCSF